MLKRNKFGVMRTAKIEMDGATFRVATWPLTPAQIQIVMQGNSTVKCLQAASKKVDAEVEAKESALQAQWHEDAISDDEYHAGRAELEAKYFPLFAELNGIYQKVVQACVTGWDIPCNGVEGSWRIWFEEDFVIPGHVKYPKCDEHHKRGLHHCAQYDLFFAILKHLDGPQLKLG